jgi:transcriptional regulatory protein LevR
MTEDHLRMLRREELELIEDFGYHFGTQIERAYAQEIMQLYEDQNIRSSARDNPLYIAARAFLEEINDCSRRVA